MASGVKGKGDRHRRKPFDTITLPSHVQNALNKEERLLKQTLQDLKLETKHTIRCISQDQQVAGTKLRTLQRRLAITQARSLQFLDRQYDAAVATYEEVLAIDPEDVSAHYNLMLAHQGAGNREEVLRERALYERFKADEAAQAITGAFRRASPEDNNERQAIHEHGHPGSRPAHP